MLLLARSRCWIDTRQSWEAQKTAESPGLTGCWVITGAAKLQILGERCKGFLGTRSSKCLGTSETLLINSYCCESPVRGGLMNGGC